MRSALLSTSLSEPRSVAQIGSKSFPFRHILIAALGFHILGCAAGTNVGASNPISTQPAVAPLITVQPGNQSVPLGLAATFSVTATGTAVQYQWSRNGTPIGGATGNTYTTPATVATDTGATFTVAVSNSAGAVTSNPASLTLTARAPKAGDLRFQQVDAASTVNGYNTGPTGIGSGIPGRLSFYFGSSIGTPLYLGPGHCVNPPVNNGAGCSWEFEQFYLPSSLSSLGLSTGYGGDFYSNLQSDLQSTSIAVSGNAPLAPNSVITSLDLQPDSNLFAASWIQSSQSTGFDASQQTVALAGLQAAASQEGAHSRVITAISYNAGSVVYLSYGWQGDPSTIYETNIATSPFANVASTIAGLATQGYILTAMTPSGNGDSYILVGTRAQGDTAARPFMTATQGTPGPVPLIQQGYSMVAILAPSSGLLTFIGER